jgi:hypothetical protein
MSKLSPDDELSLSRVIVCAAVPALRCASYRRPKLRARRCHVRGGIGRDCRARRMGELGVWVRLRQRLRSKRATRRVCHVLARYASDAHLGGSPDGGLRFRVLGGHTTGTPVGR